MLALWQAHEQRFIRLKSLPYLGYSNLAALTADSIPQTDYSLVVRKINVNNFRIFAFYARFRTAISQNQIRTFYVAQFRTSAFSHFAFYTTPGAGPVRLTVRPIYRLQHGHCKNKCHILCTIKITITM